MALVITASICTAWFALSVIKQTYENNGDFAFAYSPNDPEVDEWMKRSRERGIYCAADRLYDASNGSYHKGANEYTDVDERLQQEAIKAVTFLRR